MKSESLLLPAAFIALFSCSIGRGAIVTFDDLPEDGSGTFISSPYQDLIWNNIQCNNAILFTNVIPHVVHSVTNGQTGNYYGMVSSSNVADVFSGSEITSSSGTNFNFLSAYLTGFWNSNLNIEVQGFNGTNLLYDTTVVASATNPTLFAFNYFDVNSISFTSTGGQPAFGNDFAGVFVMDNFDFEFIPEPSSLLLTGLAALLLWPLLKRKRA
jgi:hypothetical protein